MIKFCTKGNAMQTQVVRKKESCVVFLVILKSGSIQSTDVRPGLWIGRDQVRGETEGRSPGLITPAVKMSRGLVRRLALGFSLCLVPCLLSREELGRLGCMGSNRKRGRLRVSTGYTPQAPRGMPETAARTEPCRYCVFPYADVPVVKFK